MIYKCNYCGRVFEEDYWTDVPYYCSIICVELREREMIEEGYYHIGQVNTGSHGNDYEEYEEHWRELMRLCCPGAADGELAD